MSLWTHAALNMWHFFFGPILRGGVALVIAAALVVIVVYLMYALVHLLGFCFEDRALRNLLAAALLILLVYGGFVVGTALYEYFHPNGATEEDYMTPLTQPPSSAPNTTPGDGS